MTGAAMKHMASNFAKLDKFEGVDFRRWQKKMHFLLSSMSVVYVLTTPIPEDGGDDATVEQIWKRDKWDNDDYVCRGLILNGMSDSLFDIYQNVESSKELWNSLEAKYMAEDTSSKKFLDSDKPKGNNVVGRPVVNMVEHNNSSRYNDNKGKHKVEVTCWKCEKPGHLKKDCKGGKVGNKANGSDTNGSVDGSTNSLKGQNMFNKSFQVYYVTYVSEAYYVQDDDVAWLVDSRARVHVCKDRCWFKTYESLNDGSILHMENESTALVHGRGCVDLKFSSGKIVLLFNVLHVPNIRKNLVSSSVLNNCELNIVNDNIASAFMSTSKLNDSILWHARLGHIHFKRMQDMFKDGLISAFYIDTEKCKTCMLNKITKKPFQNVKRETEVLELIHSDLCDLHDTLSLGNKKYFVTYIDVASRAVVRLPDLKLKTLDERGIECIFVGYVEHSKAFRVPNKRNKITPYELWTKKKPNLNYLRVWGYRVVVRLPDLKLKTLDERGIECIFVGYVEHSKAFRFYVIEPNDSVAINLIIESRDAIFDENRFSSVFIPSQRSHINETEDIGSLVVPEKVPEEEQGMRSLTNTPITLNIEDDPKTFDEAMKLQMDLQKKTKVARISTMRLLIVMASIHNLIIHQMDVKTAFLNGDLEDEVYIIGN
ncbi:zinc finger, CCHC-type containing protein [Tanacetum coccineum]